MYTAVRLYVHKLCSAERTDTSCPKQMVVLLQIYTYRR